jgi:hypothetical protein
MQTMHPGIDKHARAAAAAAAKEAAASRAAAAAAAAAARAANSSAVAAAAQSVMCGPGRGRTEADAVDPACVVWHDAGPSGAFAGVAPTSIGAEHLQPLQLVGLQGAQPVFMFASMQAESGEERRLAQLSNGALMHVSPNDGLGRMFVPHSYVQLNLGHPADLQPTQLAMRSVGDPSAAQVLPPTSAPAPAPGGPSAVPSEAVDALALLTGAATQNSHLDEQH